MTDGGVLLPRKAFRRAIAVDALRFATVARLVVDAGGRLSCPDAVRELRGLGLTGGAAVATVRRALAAGEVVVDARGELALPGGAERAA